jgi:hypothetical protein
VNKYTSHYGGGELAPAQKLTEIMCERIAAKENKTLSPFFWRDEYWAKKFRMQITHANRLIKAYSFEAVYKALQLPEARKVLSFGAPFFLPIIEKCFLQITMEEKSLETSVIPEVKNTTEKPREEFKSQKKSLREKLDG